MSGEHSIVWLNNSSADHWCWVNTECELGLLWIVSGQSLQEKSSMARASSSSNSVVHEESLESRALISQSTNLVQDQINDLLSNSVVSSSIVGCSIFLA